MAHEVRLMYEFSLKRGERERVSEHVCVCVRALHSIKQTRLFQRKRIAFDY